jgi:hypothetical protein
MEIVKKSFFRDSGFTFPVVFLSGAVAALLSFGACNSLPETEPPEEPDAASPPEIISPLEQSVVYNGRPQPVDARAAGDILLIVTYYPSKGAWWFDEDGTREAPVNAGTYYVKISRPAGNGYAQGEDVMVEYHIKKAAVNIIAEKIQGASYNGDPKRVQARSEPGLPLSYSYYPSAGVRAAAAQAFSRPDESTRSTASAALRGLKRVERAPIEQGAYYVIVYYPGDDNYLPAYTEVDFTIGPPARRN